MDIHKPKPWHGVREFLKEYAIIVGALTALAAEQGVEWLHWLRHQAQVAREAITYDPAGATWATPPRRTRFHSRTVQRLGDLSDALDQAQADDQAVAAFSVSPPVTLAWSMRTWSGLTSGQTLAHLSNRDQLTLDSIDKSLEYIRVQANRERDAWALLETAAGPAERHRTLRSRTCGPPLARRTTPPPISGSSRGTWRPGSRARGSWITRRSRRPTAKVWRRR